MDLAFRLIEVLRYTVMFNYLVVTSDSRVYICNRVDF